MKKLLFAALTLLLLACLPGCGGGAADRGKPDIVLIIIDSVRSDHLSVNGYGRETTPVIDSLALSGTMWCRTQAQSSWTLPSMASLLTGIPQKSHGTGFNEGRIYGLDQTLPTLPLQLQRNARYQTAGFFNSEMVGERTGFQCGFTYFDCTGFIDKYRCRDAGTTVDDFLDWFDSDRDTGRPLFAVLHFFDPHLPYSPPPPFDTMYADPKSDPVFNPFWGARSQVDDVNRGRVQMTQEQLGIMTGLYDGELSCADRAIGRLIQGLRQRGALYNTVFVITGTQGEELLDHGGMGHGHTLYQELLDVPLIITGPGIPVSVRNEVAAQMDILPTLMAMADLAKPIWAEGMDLLSGAAEQRNVPSGNLIWAEKDLLSLRRENRLVVGNPADLEAVLYDLDADPGQNNPMAPSRDSKDQLYYIWSVPPRGHPLPVDSLERGTAVLRDLGYVR